MAIDPLIALSPLDGRYQLRCQNLRDQLSEYGLIHCRLEVEVLWLIWLSEQIADLTPLSAEAKEYLHKLICNFNLEQAQAIKQIEGKTRHDVKAVEMYLQAQFRHKDAPQELQAYIPLIHFSCTSEDINNLAYALMIQRAYQDHLQPAMAQIKSQLLDWLSAHKGNPMLARTHGQLASPTTWGKEMAAYIRRLQRSSQALAAMEFEGKINGATGNYNAHLVAFPEVDWPRLCQGFVESLTLKFNPCTTQIEPGDWLVRWLNELSLFNSICLDLCKDMWSYISIAYLQARPPKPGEVGSSTMPHKVNPIDFENAEGNLSLAIGLAQTLARDLPLSRWQRDLSGSTRWRNIAVVIGHSQIAWQSIGEGIARVAVDTKRLKTDLQPHYELLGEAAQTIMRHQGIEDAYEQIKTLSHGKKLSREDWQALVTKLPIDKQGQERLLRLTPENYIGLAEQIATQIETEVKD